MKIISTLHARPGETEFKAIAEDTAQKIAAHFYDVRALVPIHKGIRGQIGFGVKTNLGFEACVAIMRHPELGDLPAILHKTNPRRIEFIQL